VSVEENKALVLRLLQEGVNQRNLTVLDEVVASKCVFHGSDGQEVSGIEVVKQVLNKYFDAFDNFHLNIRDVIEEGDKVVVRFVEIGRHRGEFEGIAPTGKEVMWMEIAIFRVTDGSIVKSWTLEDKLSLMHQLGVDPLHP
jgi:predicted ester cyclase